MLTLIKDIRENRYALWNQFYVNIKTTVATTKLGTLWWILDPLFLMLIYYFVVKFIFNRGGVGYHLFILTGLVTYQAFSRSVSLCTTALVRSEGLIKHASLPMVVYILVSPFVQAFFCMIGIIIVMMWNFQALRAHTLAIFIPVFLMMIISFTAGLFFSIFEVYSRDTGKFVEYILRFGMFLSPVLYSADKIRDMQSGPEYLKILYFANPMVHVITAVRDILFYGKMFDVGPMLIVFAAVLVFMQLGLIFFRRLSPHVSKMF